MMGWYYRGDGSEPVPYGADREPYIRQLEKEAQQHKEASDTYRSIGYPGHSASEGQEAVRKAEKAGRMRAGLDY